MPTNRTSNQKILAIAAVIVMALLAVNAYLLFNKYKQNRVISSQQVDIEEADKLKTELEKQYYEALTNLEELRSGDEELNAVIDQQKQELKRQKQHIEKLLRNGLQLKEARIEIDNLSVQVKKYLARIRELKAENEQLALERDSLSGLSQQLLENLDSTQRANLQLAGESAALSTQKEELAAEHTKLVNTLNLASLVKVNKVLITGLKVRSNGKTVKKKFAKNVDQLRVCFVTMANDIASAGKERFYIRIINPVGETIAVDELGSGVLHLADSGEEVRYTLRMEADYKNRESEFCTNWKPQNGTFEKGKYKVEIYNKNYFAGKGELVLK
ncbi:MAG: hypothetical protein EPO28_11530 [Saprospiraceae bacterium]|nr:MAG: hypothetical protein EPO28_11530 [Saprospiraceae bacterium]